MKNCVLLNNKNVFLVGVLIGESANVVKWVTDVCYSPKVCEWNDGKEAYQFTSEEWALEIAESLLLNNVRAFVAEVCECVNAIKND